MGTDSFCYFIDNKEDYERTNLFTSSEKTVIESRIRKRITDLKDKGCNNTEIVYFIVPNPTELYPERVTSEWKY